MSAERYFSRKNSERSHTISATSMLATLCQAKVIIRFGNPGGCEWSVSHARMRWYVGKNRTRKSMALMPNIAAPTPTMPHLNIRVAAMARKKAKIEITDAGRFAASCSVATLACAEMELTMDGQMLSTTRAAATRYSGLASFSTQESMAQV